MIVLLLVQSLAFGNWSESVLSKYIHTEKEYKELVSGEREITKGSVISINTEDQETCFRIQKEFMRRTFGTRKDLQALCDHNPDQPIVTIYTQYKVQLTTANFTPQERKLFEDTRSMAAIGVAAMGILYLLPESFSNWDREEIRNKGIRKWKTNTGHRPVIDKDDWAVNYIGHPYSGAIYYTIARNAGMNQLQSFGYTAFMSTFFWEYGLEAFAEKPSIQDLLTTPILGSIIGEAFYEWTKEIEENDGKLRDSTLLGSVAIALMNPARPILDGINKAVGVPVLDKASTFIYLTNEQEYFNIEDSDPIAPFLRTHGMFVLDFNFEF